MKKRLLAMLLALMLVVGLLPVGVLAVGASNEYGSLEYDDTNQSPLQGTLSVVFQDANGQQLGDPIVVTDYEKTLAAENKITLTGDEYEIAKISASNGTLTSVSVNGTTGSFRLTFSNADSATVYVTLAEPFDKDDVVLEGEEIGHGRVVYFNINDYEIYKMLYIAGVSVPASTKIDSVKLRYVEKNQLLETEDFVELSGFISTEYVDYWQADASNGSGLATPYNVRQLEIEHHDTTTVIPYTALKYTRDGDNYWIEARNDAPYIVAFYNETGADSGNDYTLYDIRYVDISGETVAENGGMPDDPEYPNTTYQFVAWTDEYDGGKPFIETTPVTEDTVVYAQKTLSTNASEIHVMNDGDLFKDRIQELYNRDDIYWDSVKVSVYAEDGSHTEPDYNIPPDANGWRGTNGDEYYFVYNYLSGVGEQENDSVFINDITHIVVTANAIGGTPLGEVTIDKGIYDGDFSVSTGAQGSSYIIELYINDNGVEDPDDDDEPTPPEPVAKLDVDKAVAIPGNKVAAAVGDVLEYTVTITNLNSVAATGVKVTDTMWENGSSVKIGGKEGTLQGVTAGEDGCYVTVNVPANDSVDIYYTYTVPETDAGKTVGNTVTVGEMSVTTNTTVYEAEEPEDPGKPSEPTKDELNQLYVDLKCINADAQHDEKSFHLDQDNSVFVVDFTTGICTVEPRYDFILDTYNDQVAKGHTYADDAERTLLLSWNPETKAWDVAGDVASITRQVKCEPREVTVKFVDEATEEQVGEDHTLIVEPDAWNVNSSAINSEWIPEGYELAYTGDFGIVNDVVEVPVRKLPYPILVSFVDENQTPIVTQQTVKVGESATPPTDDDGRNIVGWTNNGNAYEGPYDYAALAKLVEANDGWNDYYREGYLTFEAVYERVITVKFVDEATEEQVGEDHTLIVEPDAWNVNSSAINSEWIPEGYELAYTGDFGIVNDVVEVPVRKLPYPILVSFVDENQTPIVTQQTVKVGESATPPTDDDGRNIVGWTNNGNAYEGPYDYAALAKLVEANDGWNDYYREGYLTFEAVYERVITVKFVDEATEEQVGEDHTLIVEPDAWNVNSSAIKSEWIPEGYELAYTGDFGIVNDVVEVPVRKLPYPILVSFVDENQTPIVPQKTVKVGESATPPTEDDGRKIVGWTNNGNAYEGLYDYAALAELVEANDGWNDYYREGYLTFEAVYERVITVKFVDEATEEQVGEDHTLIVEPDAWNVNSSAIKSEWIPEGYELAYTGDFGIVNDVVEVPVRKLPYPILVSFVDENQTPIVPQKTVKVGESATPPTQDDGRKIVGWTNNGNAYEGTYDYAALAELVEANDGWNDYYREGYLTFNAVYERVITVKVVDKDTEENLGTHEMTVEADAIHVNTSAIPENWIPEGYELADVGDLPIVDELLTVYVRKVTVEPDPYYIINIRFVDSDGTTSLGGGDVISTSPDAAYPSVPSPVAPQGMKFAGWKVWLGNEPMYEGAFTYNALKALREKLDGEITWVDGRTWITFQAVYEDVTVEPDPYYIINIRFVDSAGTTSLGGGDVISTSPDAAYPSVPSPVAPQGMKFAGWKVWLGNEPMYEGAFTYKALKALRERA